jgi:arylsulfatase/uncharacterized sulfatase
VVYRGDYKLRRDGPPWGDGQWRLYKYAADPTESKDLAANEPALVKQLLAEAEAYNQRNGVVLPEAGYNPLKAVLANNWQILLSQMKGLAIAVVIVLAVLVYLLWRLLRRTRRPRPA